MNDDVIEYYICSNCGAVIEVSMADGGIDNVLCPVCNRAIVSTAENPDGGYDIAIVEEK